MRDVKIGAIVQSSQPGIHKQLNKKNHSKKKRSRRGSQEHLSFSDLDRMMRQKADIDERKCQGR